MTAENDKETPDGSVDLPTAFSLARFIPLLRERIFVINPFTRTFLVGWITLLDSIPDLELVSFLPQFLGGLFKFLSDPNRDVHVATQGALERFLSEIKRISRIKKGIEESRKSRSDGKRKRSESMDSDGSITPDAGGEDDSATAPDEKDISSDDDWVPGQDVQVSHKEIMEILTTNLDSPLGKVFRYDTVIQSLTCTRRRVLAGIFTLDRRIPGDLPGRGVTFRSQNPCPSSSSDGKWCGDHSTSRCSSEHFSDGLCGIAI